MFQVEIFNSVKEAEENIDDLMIKKIQLEEKHQSEKEKDFEVEHSYIDFRQYQLELKLIKVNNEKLPYKITPAFSQFEVADMVSQIAEKQLHQLENFKCLQKIIDYQFELSKIYFKIQFLCFVLFYLVPFIFQMFVVDNPRLVRTLNMISMTT